MDSLLVSVHTALAAGLAPLRHGDGTDHLFEFGWVHCARHGLLERNDAAQIEVAQRLIHGLHTKASTGLDHRGDLVGLVFTDEIANGRASPHDLHGAYTTGLAGPRKQLL